MWSALSTGGWRGEGGNCSCTCPGLSLSRSGHGLAVQLPQCGVVNGNRQRNLWCSESVRNYLKYLLAFSSWNICEAPPRCAPAPAPSTPLLAMCTKLCNGMQRWPGTRSSLLPFFSPLEKMQLNAFWSCLACAAHSGDFVLTFAACFGIS